MIMARLTMMASKSQKVDSEIAIVTRTSSNRQQLQVAKNQKKPKNLLPIWLIKPKSSSNAIE